MRLPKDGDLPVIHGLSFTLRDHGLIRARPEKIRVLGRSRFVSAIRGDENFPTSKMIRMDDSVLGLLGIRHNSCHLSVVIPHMEEIST